MGCMQQTSYNVGMEMKLVGWIQNACFLISLELHLFYAEIFLIVGMALAGKEKKGRQQDHFLFFARGTLL